MTPSALAIAATGPAAMPASTAPTRPIAAICVGNRYRKEMGDLDALAASIREHGLLHPVVITADGQLVAGERRLRACALLGWQKVPVTVVSVDDLLRAERDENEVRKSFTPSEAVAIGRVIEEKFRAENKERQRQNARATAIVREARRKGKTETNLENLQIREVPRGITRDDTAAAVGMSGPTYGVAKTVVAAAEADPAAFGDLVEHMDRTGQIHGAYNTLLIRKSAASNPAPDTSPARAPEAKPAPRHAVLHKLRYRQPNREVERAINALEAIAAGLKQINPQSLDSERRAQWAAELKSVASAIARFAREIINE
jgi:ParB family transcriptional regulator, chromosome partitioning protein